MRNLTFQIDYTYCPKGHADWIFVPSSTLYSDVFWCEKCDYFYVPTVKKVSYIEINKDYNSDRAKEVKQYAEFLKWRKGLTRKDMDFLTAHNV